MGNLDLSDASWRTHRAASVFPSQTFGERERVEGEGRRGPNGPKSDSIENAFTAHQPMQGKYIFETTSLGALRELQLRSFLERPRAARLDKPVPMSPAARSL